MKENLSSSGLETANSFLRTKLELVQKDLDKALAEKSTKENKIKQLQDDLKKFEEEKRKSSKTVGGLESQIEKLKKLVEEYKEKQQQSEAEILTLKKVNFTYHFINYYNKKTIFMRQTVGP